MLDGWVRSMTEDEETLGVAEVSLYGPVSLESAAHLRLEQLIDELVESLAREFPAVKIKVTIY